MTMEPPWRQVVVLATCDDARVALTATIYTADIDLADHDRGVYETLALRVARHPSESDDYLVTRLLAYALEYTEGLEFSTGGLSSPDDPALAVRDLTGALRAWIEIGWPDGARLHKAAKASPRVAVYPHRDAGQWLKRLEGERIHRAADIARPGHRPRVDRRACGSPRSAVGVCARRLGRRTVRVARRRHVHRSGPDARPPVIH